MLYLYLANGLDQVKITLTRFISGLKYFLLDEDKHNQSRACFQILDIDRDGVLNIVNLLHLYKNIPPRSAIGQELIKVISFFLEKNLYSKSFMSRVEINLDVFLKVLNQRTCLTAEIRRTMLGIQGSLKEMKDSGKLAVKQDSDDEDNDDNLGLNRKGKKKVNA